MSLIFFSSTPLMPKWVAISTICRGLTKSFGLEQNFSMPGSNSRQPILLGMLRPSPHLPSDLYRIQNSQTIIHVRPSAASLHGLSARQAREFLQFLDAVDVDDLAASIKLNFDDRV